MTAGSVPIPKNGIIIARIASDGIVCSTLVSDRTTLAVLSVRVSTIPSGTAISIAASSDMSEMDRCSIVFARSSV